MVVVVGTFRDCPATVVTTFRYSGRVAAGTQKILESNLAELHFISDGGYSEKGFAIDVSSEKSPAGLCITQNLVIILGTLNG